MFRLKFNIHFFKLLTCQDNTVPKEWNNTSNSLDQEPFTSSKVPLLKWSLMLHINLSVCFYTVFTTVLKQCIIIQIFSSTVLVIPICLSYFYNIFNLLQFWYFLYTIISTMFSLQNILSTSHHY